MQIVFFSSYRPNCYRPNVYIWNIHLECCAAFRWAWGQGQSHYLTMIIGAHAALGVFLVIASRNPYTRKEIIDFTVWSSVVHGAIMGVQSINDAAARGHLIGDVPALFLVAIILAV
jgi:hypothetical protein